MPYLKEAMRRGHRAFLKDELIVNGRTYDLDYLLRNFQLETGSGGQPCGKQVGGIGGNKSAKNRTQDML